jgi:hypothetical protein
MASNEEVVNMKVVRLIEANNFAFWVIAIRGDMQPPGWTQPIRHEMHRCLIKCVSKLSISVSTNWMNFLQFCLIYVVKIWSDGKVLNIKVLCFFETNNFDHYAILIRDRFLPQNRPVKYRKVFDRTVLESSDPPIRIQPKLGFWTWIQPSFLHGKSSRSLYS